MSRGVKNIQEVISLIFTIILLIVKEIKKDGFQYTDLFGFLGSDDFKEELTLALEDVSEVPGEAIEITLEEGFDLGMFVIKKSWEVLKVLIGRDIKVDQ